jgi:hypothetical protein
MEETMQHKFYDVKTKQAVTTEVLECVTFQTAKRTSYAFKGKTADGRSLTAFVSKEVWDKANK